MTEKHPSHEKVLFERAAGMLKVHGILAIIFGSLGVFFGMLFILAIGLGGLASSTLSDLVGLTAISIFAVILWVLPHVYLIISGTTLLKGPAPRVAKTLIIINLVLGVFWNLILMIFAIIDLTQIDDYEEYYDKFAKK